MGFEPERSGPCECRKPGRLLYRLAAGDYGIDLTRSVFLGDRWRDVAPGRALGGRGILIPGPNTPDEDRTKAGREAEVAADLASAVVLVVGPHRG